VQTFTVTYKKPFKANGLTDINMKPLKYYNLTSAYGCYTNAKKDNVITQGTKGDMLRSGTEGAYVGCTS